MLGRVLVFFMLEVVLFALHIESSYESAHQKALKTKKVLVVFVMQKGCSECNKELAKLIQNREVTTRLEAKGYFVVVVQNQKETYPIEMLYSEVYPAVFFLNKEELFVCDTLQGEIEVSKLLECLE